MKRNYLFLFLCCLLSLSMETRAQRQTENWFFGIQASLEFSSNRPASFFISAMAAPEGCATISDKGGNLMFYTDGQTVWNRMHQTMLNGNGLLGNPGSSQSSLIVPKPGNDSLYYLFTTDENVAGNSTNGLRYSIINMRAQNGMGEILAGSKNILLTGNGPNGISEKLAGVHHFNNQDVWVLTHRFPSTGNQEFIAYKVTASGISATPVISALPAGSFTSDEGYLKISHKGDKIAGCFVDQGFQLLDFDNKTGQVNNPQTLFYGTRPAGTNSYYSAEFSPDGQKLYASFKSAVNNTQLWQYDLSSGSLPNIISSRYTLTNIFYSNGLGLIMALQLAPNGKIYLTHNGTNQLSEIANPNGLGSLCNYKTASVLPNNMLAMGSLHGYGLPNFIQSYFAPPRFNFTGICAESPTVFTIPNIQNVDSVLWNFGDPGSISPNTSSQFQASHTFYQPGTYTVTLTLYTQGHQVVHERPVTILNKPQVSLGRDTLICEGAKLNLASTFPHSPFNERFLWSTGDTVPAIVVTDPGVYWLELSNGFCTTRDSITISTKKPPKVDLGPDFYTCGNGTVTLDAGNPGAQYLWQPGGETTQTITVSATGTFSVTVSANGCSATDIANVTILDIGGFKFGDDIVACEGEVITLDPRVFTGTGTTFFWNDSSAAPTLQVTKSGKYWLRLWKSGCLFTDTINVSFKPCPPPPVPVIPNIITPNGDNLNDKLVISEIPVGVWNLKLYNRWGILIFDKKGYQNEWPKEKISHGTYYYLLEDPETKRLFKGWIEVVK